LKLPRDRVSADCKTPMYEPAVVAVKPRLGRSKKGSSDLHVKSFPGKTVYKSEASDEPPPSRRPWRSAKPQSEPSGLAEYGAAAGAVYVLRPLMTYRKDMAGRQDVEKPCR